MSGLVARPAHLCGSLRGVGRNRETQRKTRVQTASGPGKDHPVTTLRAVEARSHYAYERVAGKPAL